MPPSPISGTQSALGPPTPERRPVRLEAHGDVRIDDWFWLRDKDDPAVIEHLEAENAYTEAAMAGTGALQAELFEEIVARIEETDLSVPVRKGPWLYYSRTVEGSNYAIHCRRPATAAGGPGAGDPPGQRPAGEEVILDENLLAAGHDYLAVGSLSVSPDHRWLAYSTDTSGGERFTMRFTDLEAQTQAPESLDDTSYGVAWANDNATVFFVRVDEAMRPYQLWRHRVGTDPGTDVVVYQETDDRFYLGVGRTKDDRFVLMGLDSKVTSEVRALRADDPLGTFSVIEPRRQGIEYSVDHDRGDERPGRPSRFLIVTNDGAEDFRLMEAPDDSPDRSHWREVIGGRPGVRLDNVDPFVGHLVVYEREGGETRVRVIDAVDGASTPVRQPESPSTVWGGANPEYESKTLRYEYTSLTTPRSVYDLDLESGDAVLLKRQPVLGDFDPGRYRTERLWAVADDGTEVPISMVYRPDLVHRPGSADGSGDGSGNPATDPGPADGRAGVAGAPCLLYGYGSYEASMDPMFSSLRLSLLDRGFIFAIAHVRGGGEMGRAWYEQGKLAAKPNTFTDFVACARALIARGWTSPDRLVARGGSAGGLLMGAVANLAPDLFRAMVAEVPFVDCLTTILDETLPLTVLEWEEWGNPVEDPVIYQVMKSYSPYDNVRAVDDEGQPVRYPDILATAGLSDPRVGFWEPAKWVAKLRAANPENKVLLKTELGAGHGGPSGRYDAWKDEAFVYTFILDTLGLVERTAGPRPADLGAAPPG
ncbi:MAG: S9 family peptidase [Acidimicrobiales bacterium]|jgi:oligopeptidase B